MREIRQSSVQGNHLHLVCEAKDKRALGRGMKRLKLRIANGMNRQLGRRGSVFFDRYHFEILRSPRQVRNALCYVLHNAKRHGLRVSADGVDPYSSGWWFDGWRTTGWKTGVGPPADRPCVASARTWLLSRGWRRHGLITIEEVPQGRAKP